MKIEFYGDTAFVTDLSIAAAVLCAANGDVVYEGLRPVDGHNGQLYFVLSGDVVHIRRIIDMYQHGHLHIDNAKAYASELRTLKKEVHAHGKSG